MATVRELEERVVALEALVRELKARLDASSEPKKWTDLAGMFADDPAMAAAHAEATRLGREWRERENRKSLAAFDRAEAREKAKAEKRAKATAKKRPAGRGSRASA